MFVIELTEGQNDERQRLSFRRGRRPTTGRFHSFWHSAGTGIVYSHNSFAIQTLTRIVSCEIYSQCCLIIALGFITRAMFTQLTLRVQALTLYIRGSISIIANSSIMYLPQDGSLRWETISLFNSLSRQGKRKYCHQLILFNFVKQPALLMLHLPYRTKLIYYILI